MQAFVLMPFDPEFDAVYERLIEPALSAAGFSVTRADLSVNQQQILKDIVIGIASADLVVVDVTGLNGNVMYELGLAHAMGRRTVMITRDVDELPFDLRSYRANGYSTEFTEAPRLAERLREIADGVVSGAAQFSNPVLDFAPDFLGRAEQVSAGPTEPASTGQLDEAPTVELGLVDFAIQLAESGEAITAISERIGAATTQIGDRVAVRGEQLTKATNSLGAKAAPTLRKILRDTATEFDEFSEELEAQNPQLLDQLKLIGQSANGLARLRSNATDEEKQRIREEIATFSDAEATFASVFTSVTGFAGTLEGLPSMEQQLNAAVKRSVIAVNDTASAIDLGRSEFARVRGLLQERLGE